MKVRCKIKDPFPVEKLGEINLGHADGHRDSLIEDAFVTTGAIKSFLSDRHSIIVGPFGAGKSALFKLLKKRSERLPTFLRDLIVPIEEKVQFSQLRKLSAEMFSSLNEDVAFQLVWRFQICRRLAEELAKLPDFPQSKDEKYVSTFLVRSGGEGGETSVVDSLRELFDTMSFKLKAKLSDTPVAIEVGKEAQSKVQSRVELNLDELLSKCESIIESRGFRRATVAIDKIDKFVAGEDYLIQRLYIQALLEVEDDLHARDRIKLKVFLREDLYERLNFSAIGPDKSEFNTLKLRWAETELKAFVARRLLVALEGAEIWDFSEVLESTDLSEFQIKWYDRIILEDNNESFQYKFALWFKRSFVRKVFRNALFDRLDKAIILKLFADELHHKNGNGVLEAISCEEFFDTHFLDGNDSCTPRYVLIFLERLVSGAYDHYTKSPDAIVSAKNHNNDWVWGLFFDDLVYDAYTESKKRFLGHVAKIDDAWTPYILEFMNKKEGKQKFDHKWVMKNLSFGGDDRMGENFLTFLQVIGFLKVDEYHPDVRHRNYILPILYREAVA